MKRLGVWVLRILLALVVLLLLGWWYLARQDFGGYFQERRGTAFVAEEEPAGEDSLFRRSWVRLRTPEDFSVLCGMLAPKALGDTVRRYPAIIVLGGKATGRYAVDYALDIQDVMLVAPDYPYEPRESYTVPEFLGDVPAIRRAIVDMIPSVMLIMDYLARRPDVDTTRIVLLGYSFGAPFVPVIMAHDQRPAVAAMVYGGGDLESLIRHNVARYEGEGTSRFVGWLAGLLLRPLEPLRYAGRIAPTPLVMINGTEDEQVPRVNTVLLYEAAREPKKLIWIESRHVHPRNVELTRRIIATLRSELVRLHILPSQP
jgi:dienelactone hydrolase